MEFQGKGVPKTKGVPGIVYVGDLQKLYPEIIEKAASTEFLVDDTSEEVEDAVLEHVRYIDFSDAQDNVEWMLLNDPDVYDFNELRVHFAEVTGEPYVRFGEKDDIEELKADGIAVIDDDYILNDYLSEMFEKARLIVHRDIKLGNIAVFAVAPELLSEEEKSFLENGISYELVIEKLEDIFAQEIADAYIKRLNECRADGADYGLNTAIALAREKQFKGNRDYALALYSQGLLSESDVAELEKYELISKAIITKATKPLEGDDVGSGFIQSERFGAMHEFCYTVGYPCEGCGFGEHTIDDASNNDKEK